MTDIANSALNVDTMEKDMASVDSLEKDMASLSVREPTGQYSEANELYQLRLDLEAVKAVMSNLDQKVTGLMDMLERRTTDAGSATPPRNVLQPAIAAAVGPAPGQTTCECDFIGCISKNGKSRHQPGFCLKFAKQAVTAKSICDACTKYKGRARLARAPPAAGAAAQDDDDDDDDDAAAPAGGLTCADCGRTYKYAKAFESHKAKCPGL